MKKKTSNNLNIVEHMNSFYGMDSLPFVNDMSHPNVTMFPIAKGQNINVGDFVVVHKKRGTAYKPKKYMGRGFASVGQAVLIGERDKKQWVVCRDGVYAFENTMDSSHSISKAYGTKSCYFESDFEVCDDCRDTSEAGRVCGTAVVDAVTALYDVVFVRIDVHDTLEIKEEE